MVVRAADVGGGTHRVRLGDIVGLAGRMRRSEVNAYPAAVTRDETGRLELLAGGRRFAARRQYLGDTPAAVIVCTTWSDFAQWMIADTEASKDYDRKPTTYSEALRLIEKVNERLTPPYNSGVDSTVCAYLDLRVKETQYIRSTLKRYVKADVTDEVRRYALVRISDANAGKISAHTAFSHAKAHAESLAASKATMPAAEQRRRFQVAHSTLAGVLGGLADVGTIHPDMTEAEIGQYIESLSGVRLQLERTIKGLRAARGESK